MPPWDPHRAGSHTNPTCSRRPLLQLHTARDFEVLRGVPGWHDHAESKRPLKLAPTRRQLPRDISRRSRAREHDLRARIVAPELAQPTRSIRWRGGGDWAGYPRSISPIAAETRRAPLPELCSTTGRRSASPAAYRATSGVDAPCCAGCEVLRQRTAVASFCTLKSQSISPPAAREGASTHVRTSARDRAASQRHGQLTWHLQSKRYSLPGTVVLDCFATTACQ